jgi:hypothetical protein
MYDSKLEKDFHKLWKSKSKLPLVTQHKFHPRRQWRFDFAHKPTLTAIEIQGYGEGHTSYDGMASDYEKHNQAILHGWIIIYIMSKDVTPQKMARTVTLIERIISNRPLAKQKVIADLPPPKNAFEDLVKKLLDP